MPSLSDIKVLDLSHALAGPFCTMLLTELGADVIKLEPPGGDHFRPSNSGGTFATVNRRKRGISLDLRRPRAHEVMTKLIADADLFVQSFTPGTIDRLGYGYEAVSALKPDIIYCSISGFGNTGPYQDLRGYDGVIQAVSGIMMATGEPDRPPVRGGPSLIDIGTGSYLTIAILDALRERDRSGKGKRLDFNLLETALSWMSPSIAGYSITGKLPQRTGSALSFYSPYQVFAAQDGYVFIAVSTDRLWERFCTGLDHETYVNDERFVSREARVANRDVLTGIIEEHLAGLSVSEVFEKMRAASVPCAPVNTLQDILDDPHVEARGTLSRHHDPSSDREVVQVRSPIGVDLDATMRPAPSLGQDTRAVLGELGYGTDEIDGFFASGLALGEGDG